ncbi:MAG TPA: DUF1549 domain-containing protein [Bryobacteraceae bacterium]|nr:DUF1549 domain-containing protein [Bryobacteraceae bacterium]
MHPLVCFLVFCMALPVTAETGEEFFEKSVRPLLVARCAGCHGTVNPAGGLKLDSRESLLKGGGRGPAVVAGKPAGSLLLQALRHTAGTLKMPPGPKLSDADLATLTRWVELGVPWGQPSAGASKNQKFWAFVPPVEPLQPAVRNATWAKTPIDRFVLARLEEKGLSPAAPADKRTLLRRATYDLTGLPPTPEETQVFLNDTSHGAFDKVIERLLSSPRYGERWGRHWLDVARYADSNGLDENLVYKNAWRYRDYVIAAFNKDKPYDQFVQEQIAGDLLPEGATPETTFERWTATGFLSLGAKMLAEDDPVKMEMDIIDEQVDTIGKTFMGLTVGCARCHDHKFDPIPTADYYSMAGIFKSTHTMDNFKVVAKWHEHVLAPKADRDRLAAHEARLEAKRKEAGRISSAENKRLQAEAYRSIGAYLLAAYDIRRNSGMKLHPLPESAAAKATIRDAASFDNGNVSRPIEKKKRNAPKDAKGPFFAEYNVKVERAGDYQLDALDEERGGGTADILINGELVMRGAGAVENREASPDAGGWAALGVFPLKGGENIVRLQHRTRFPYFEKLRLAPSPFAPGQGPRNDVQIARAYGVNPLFLAQLGEHLNRSNGAPASVLYAFETWGAAAKQGPWSSPAAKLFEGFKPADVKQLTARYQELFSEALRQWEALPAADRAKKETKLTVAAFDALRQFLTEPFGAFGAPAGAREYYTAEAKRSLDALDAEQKELEASTPDLPHAMGVREGKSIGDLPIHIRGSHWTLGEPVARHFLTAVPAPQPQIGKQSSGRLELVQWLTRRDHPLTARVMVNRLWRWHFGRGIVPSPDNFGRLGEMPTNQPLLDWMALRFMEGGWSVKAMHRLIMQSATYQMSSAYDERSFEADPENSLHWRANRLRLEAEAIRDGIMAVSGDLQLAAGGTLLPYKDRQYVANTSRREGVDYEKNIRAVYIPVVRSSLYDVFSAFDLPDPAVTQGDRNSTVIAPQALFMMNGAVMLRHSRKMAEALLAKPVDDSGRIRDAYERALTRPPSPREIDQALSFISQVSRALPASVSSADERNVLAWQSFCKALLASNEFIYLN